MATFRTCIFAHQRRADGTYNIKLRITHHRKSRGISTTLYALPDDLTRGLKIKDEKLSRKCRELVEDCIDLCNDMGYAVEEMEIDELVARIKSGLKGGERFRLDFIAYMRQEAARMNSGTASIYMTALNALRRYIGRDTLDIGEITAPFIKGFVQFIESEPSQRGANRKQKGETATKNKGNRALSLYISRIKTIYKRAPRNTRADGQTSHLRGVDTADNRLAATRQRTRSDGAGLLPPVVRTDGDEQRRSADLPAGQEGRNRVFPAKNRIPPHGPCRNARSDRAVRQPFDRSLFG